MMMHGIGMLVFLIPTIGLIGGGLLLLVWLVRRAGNGSLGLPLPGSPPAPLASGREIVQARYARGEIDREQYLAMLADLN